MAIYIVDSPNKKWWFSIVTLVYQRVTPSRSPPWRQSDTVIVKPEGGSQGDGIFLAPERWLSPGSPTGKATTWDDYQLG
jgi:glutathione synthase/RimK-type ligase-like ATP-grasp enzyme